jgi:Flp pilus assembly protein TadG
MAQLFRKAARRFLRHQRGNVLMIAGFAIMPMVIGTGMVIDYSQGARLQTKMNAIADAAALAAVTSPMMKKTTTDAKNQAISLFKGQAAGLRGLVFDPNTQLTVTITDATGTGIDRQATVSYTAQSSNSFGGILGMSTIAIGGTSTAKAAESPNIDFYVMVDTSPSMAIPATSAGVAAMIKATKSQGGGAGCAFACHQSETTKTDPDPNGANRVNGKYVDNYYVAKTMLGLTLRVDLVQKAVADLTDTAVSTSAETKATYRFAMSKFDVSYTAVLNTPTSPAAAKSAAQKLTLLTVCRNNQLNCGTDNNDMDTNFTAAFNGALQQMPLTSGTGGNRQGDAPQAMLFLITDGMRDENSSGRKLGPIPTTQCTTIKNRGIRIAVLYTDYLYESANDGWSITNVRDKYLAAPDKISPALIECASPGLFYKVTSNDDISASLAALFQKAIATAHLTR